MRRGKPAPTTPPLEARVIPYAMANDDKHCVVLLWPGLTSHNGGTIVRTTVTVCVFEKRHHSVGDETWGRLGSYERMTTRDEIEAGPGYLCTMALWEMAHQQTPDQGSRWPWCVREEFRVHPIDEKKGHRVT